MAAQGRVAMDLLGLDHFDTEFCLPSRLASHPTAWLVSIGGLLYDARTLPTEVQAELARRGLTPGILVPPGPTNTRSRVGGPTASRGRPPGSFGVGQGPAGLGAVK